MQYFAFLQESEIVEVLWKQDVDLGYSLTPFVSDLPQLAAAANQSDEDNEKLKALEEIKNAKVRNYCVRYIICQIC